MRALLLLSFTLLFLGNTGLSQNYRFNEYGIEDGIAQNFIYTMEQDDKGYLWIGTGEGLCQYNGQNFKTYTTKNGLAEDVVISSFMANDKTVWFGHNGGQLTHYAKGAFKKYSDKKKAVSTINAISSAGKDVIFVSQNEGLFTMTNGKYISLGKFGATSFYAVQGLDQSNIIVGTDKGLLHIAKVGKVWKKIGAYLNGRQVSAISQGKMNRVFFVATDDGIICQLKLSDKKLVLRQWNVDYLGPIQIRSIIQDDQLNVWIGTTANGLIKIPATSENGNSQNTIIYNTLTGLNSDVVQTIFEDREGGIWVGTFGAGLSSLVDDFFTFYQFEQDDAIRNITAIGVDNNYRWFGTSSGLIRTKLNGTDEVNFSTSNGIPNDAIKAIYCHQGSVYIGTEKSGMYVIEKDATTAKKINWKIGLLCDQINQIDANADYLWIATNGGLVSYDFETHKTEVYGTESGLGHNAIQTVLVDHSGDIWIGTYSRAVYKITETGIDEIELVDAGQLQVQCIVEDFEYNIWIGTAESGVFKLSDGKIDHFSMKNGLKSNYIYSLRNDLNNNMWVGHRGAMSKIQPSNNLVTTYDYTVGIQGQVNARAMILDRKYNLWIGTDNGAIQYNASKDIKGNLPPIISLVKIWINEKAYDPTDEIVLPYGTYRIQFEYIGISFKNSEKITYKFKLSGHDAIYSDATKEMVATYGRISDGEYTFLVNAYSADGITNAQPASIRIIIAKPFWKQVWFIILLLILLLGSVFGFIQFRTNRLQRAKELLQVKLEEKTKEVVENAAKIHEINKDLTDSINYAERIQQSILPSAEMLRANLPNSFLYFQPRDVVSGDFYFIERIDNKLIVACADCTGHGVPGAFVSLIGSVTLRNIYAMSKWQWKTPDQVLEQLDMEVQNILHRKDGQPESRLSGTDGMDISLCEINLDTREVLIASAKRTSLLCGNGELKKLKGDIRSIGGLDPLKTKFSLKRLQLEKGDSLYLFTDGFTDQFGGEHDKKLMLSGVVHMVSTLHQHDRTRHQDAVRAYFEQWKENTPQVDDVLFIGLLF